MASNERASLLETAATLVIDLVRADISARADSSAGRVRHTPRAPSSVHGHAPAWSLPEQQHGRTVKATFFVYRQAIPSLLIAELDLPA